MLDWINRILDAIMALAAYVSGRRDASSEIDKKAVRDARKAKAIESRMAGDAGYASRVRELFTRDRLR